MNESFKRTTTTAAILLGVVFVFGACGSRGGGGGGGGSGDGPSYEDCISGEITTWGEAPVFTSVDASRDKAKENACRKAIEKCIGEEVAKISGVSDGQSIANEVFSKSQGVCKNDQIVSEKPYKLDTIDMLKVFVRFKVTEADIKTAINTAQKLAGNPKVMVLIREDHVAKTGRKTFGFTDPRGKASAALRQVLISKGYEVVPADRVVTNTIGNQEAAIAEDPNSDAVKETFNTLKDRVAQAGVDVLIIGEIETEHQSAFDGKLGKFISYVAKGNVRVMTMWGKGKELMVYSKTGRGADLTHEAASQAAAFRYVTGYTPDEKTSKITGNPKLLARDVLSTLQNEWARVTKANQILMNITKMDAKAAGIFRDDLKERTAVKEVVEQSTQGDTHVWEVTYPGRSFALADTIAYYGDNPTMFVVVQKTCRKLKVKSVKRGEIDVEMVEVGSDKKYRCVPPS